MRNPTGVLVVGTLPGFDAIEFKAGPRQVVCAGSGHPNGKPYMWRAGTVALKDAPAIPDNLLAAITRPPVPDRVGQDEPGDLDNEQLARLLSGLDPCQYGDRDKWRNLSAACHHATNGHGFEAWEEWCAKDDRFDTEKDLSDRAALWKDFDKRKPTKVRTVATIYRALQDAGRRDLVPGRHQGIYAEWQKMNEADRLRKVVKDFENE